jgi:hypothetical protein
MVMLTGCIGLTVMVTGLEFAVVMVMHGEFEVKKQVTTSLFAGA